LRKGSRGFMAKEYPADACGAICLSFRALVRLSLNIWSTNLEMNPFYFTFCILYCGLADLLGN